MQRILPLAALVLVACQSAPAGTPLSAEPAPGATKLSDMLCLSGVGHPETLRNPDAMQAEIGRMQELGVHAIRFELFWTEVERTAGVYDLDFMETPLRLLEAADIRPIVMLGYSNALYNGRPDGDGAVRPLHEGGRATLWNALPRL